MTKRNWQWSNSVLADWAEAYHGARCHEAIAEVCQLSGLRGIEGNIRLFGPQTLGELETLADVYRDAGVAVASFHLPFRAATDDIASFYESIRVVGVDTMKRWMERAAAIGSTVVIQHPTINGADVAVEGLDPFLRAIGKSLEALLPVAESLNIKLALENMLPGTGARFGSQPEHFAEILKRFDHPHLGFCLDTGHALVSCHDRAGEMFEVMSPNLAAFHLVDNSGDRDSHLAPGRGNVKWDAVFKGMARIGFTGVACIEAPPFAYGPNYRPDDFKQMIKEIDALADRALG